MAFFVHQDFKKLLSMYWLAADLIAEMKSPEKKCGDSALLRSPVLFYSLGPVVLSLWELHFCMKCLCGVWGAGGIWFCLIEPQCLRGKHINRKMVRA